MKKFMPRKTSADDIAERRSCPVCNDSIKQACIFDTYFLKSFLGILPTLLSLVTLANGYVPCSPFKISRQSCLFWNILENIRYQNKIILCYSLFLFIITFIFWIHIFWVTKIKLTFTAHFRYSEQWIFEQTYSWA